MSDGFRQVWIRIRADSDGRCGGFGCRMGSDAFGFGRIRTVGKWLTNKCLLLISVFAISRPRSLNPSACFLIWSYPEDQNVWGLGGQFSINPQPHSGLSQSWHCWPGSHASLRTEQIPDLQIHSPNNACIEGVLLCSERNCRWISGFLVARFLKPRCRSLGSQDCSLPASQHSCQ